MTDALMPSEQKIRDTKRDLICLAIAIYNYEKPIEIAERAMKSLEDYERKLNNQRNEYEPNDVMAYF